MRNPFTVILVILLIISFTYSIFVLHIDSEDNNALIIKNDRQTVVAKDSNSERSSKIPPAYIPKPQLKPSINKQPKAVTEEQGLPIAIRLMGINAQEQKGLFESGGQLDEYIVGDSMFGYDIEFNALDKETATLSYQNKSFILTLNGDNLLIEEDQQSYEELLAMSPSEIGTRPKIVEHFVTLTETPYIADGMIVSPGINPELFKQAGLQPDDVLQTINGLSVTVEEDFKKIQRMMRNSNTLVLVVQRRGRQLTLYLDIPGEELSISL
ncbi:hypothetical protein [Glaciecola sp. 1036]|uniref:hypothetical protein n=1 Tax=Alteromonadaceae TaxID=72275 RepID=UPI003D02802B